MFLAVAVFLTTSCNNDKGKTETTKDTREKDDYRDSKENGKDKEEDNTAKTDWSASDVRTFNSDCRREMAGKISEDQLDQFCACLLDKFDNTYTSLSQFNKESTEEDGSTAAQQCMTQMNIGNGNNNTNTNKGWTASEEKRFMDECEGSARPNVGAARANEYCDCMLQKTKRVFSSYAEADRGLTQLPELQSMIDDCNKNQ